MKKELCENCREIVEVKVKENKKKTIIKGKEYEYREIIGYCSNCGEVVSTGEIIDENLKRIDKVYREKENIITKEQINDILRKYKIGKKPLSKLLGWGEVTLTRYINGDIPTKPYSDELLKILKDSNYMLEILEKNQEKITPVAYKRLKNSIEEEKTISNIELIAQYIILLCQEITPLALQKILYYAQGFYQTFFGEFLFIEDCEAWVHGPVYVKIYEKYKRFGSSNIEQNLDYDVTEMIDEDKKALLNVVINSFGYYNGKALEKMTHYEQPWIIARKGIPVDAKSNNVIEKANIKSYFLKIKEKYDMLNLLEIKNYSEDQFNKVILYTQ